MNKMYKSYIVIPSLICQAFSVKDIGDNSEEYSQFCEQEIKNPKYLFHIIFY